MDESPTELRGVLSRVRFHERDFLIGDLSDGITVKGRMPSPTAGIEYAFLGRFVQDPRFGRQYVFDAFRTIYPTDPPSIRAYLMRRGRGIGAELSARLVEAYGAATLSVCRDDPDRVAREVKGVRPEIARELGATLRDNEAHESAELELVRLLAGTRVPRAAIERMLAEWGPEAPERIHENPYALVGAIAGIGFGTADQIASRTGIAEDDPRRAAAGAIHVLRDEAQAHGHTCLPRTQLIETAATLLAVPREAVESVLTSLITSRAIVSHEDSLALPPYDAAERGIARRLRALVGPRTSPGVAQVEGLAADQRDALLRALTCGVMVLTGPPGSGKTYLLRRILDSFPNARVALAAPTGKAAKRMSEQSRRPAQTIHKLLEPAFAGGEFVFARSAADPIEADLLVLDEVSMIDARLMAALLDAVDPSTRLILVGDTDQLPAVGPGNVLRDIIASERVPCASLTEIKRQDEGLIVRNCHRVRAGEMVEIDNANATDFFFVEREHERDIRDLMLDLVAERLPRRYGADPVRDIQVLAPLRRRTLLGCDTLNPALRARLNPSGSRGTLLGTVVDGAGPAESAGTFAVGDKVIQTRNDYEREILNGDLGIVTRVERQVLTVLFESPPREIDLEVHRNDLELAYALTVHKFQGSEARIVVIPVHASAGPLIMQRAWLYTAISRAQEICVLVGQRREVRRAIERDRQQRRHTRLEQLLRGVADAQDEVTQ